MCSQPSGDRNCSSSPSTGLDQPLGGALQVHRVPQHDSRRHQVEAAGPVALLLTDQRTLELGEGPHHRQHQVGHRRVLAGEYQPLLQELDAYAALGQLLYKVAQVVEVAGQTIHAVHHHGVALADEAQ